MYPCSVCPVVCIVPCKLFPLQCVYSPLQCWGYPCLAAYMSNVYYKLYSPLQCEKVPCKLQAAMCVVYFLCAGARTLVTRSSARRQNVGGNLSICVHSRRTLHIVQVCACASHIYQFVLIRWHRGRQPRVWWERRDHGNYLLIIRGSLPIFSRHHSSQTYHFVIPSARSNAPNG